jgi:hypothetical protein
MSYNFPPKEGTGIDRLIPNASPECIDIIKKLLAYNPDDRYVRETIQLPSISINFLPSRLSARQALRHSYFNDLREMEKRTKTGVPVYTMVASADTNGNNPDDISSVNTSTNGKLVVDPKKKQQQFNSINSSTEEDVIKPVVRSLLCGLCCSNPLFLQILGVQNSGHLPLLKKGVAKENGAPPFGTNGIVNHSNNANHAASHIPHTRVNFELPSYTVNFPGSTVNQSKDFSLAPIGQKKQNQHQVSFVFVCGSRDSLLTLDFKGFPAIRSKQQEDNSDTKGNFLFSIHPSTRHEFN